MSFKAAHRAGFVTTTALAMFAASPTIAVAESDNAARLLRHHEQHAVHRGPAAHQTPIYEGEALPPGPEYGFLHHVPPNAVRGPGYTFVPGKGILGAACDLPSSACSNEYRDTQ